MDANTLFVVFLIFLALIFDFTNGFHDAANTIATIVASGVLKPLHAVIWSAFFNFIALLFFELAVAKTIGTGLIKSEIVSPYLIFATLASAISWNLITWYFAMPSSSSHALIGGLAGSALAGGGLNALVLTGFVKVIFATVFSPFMGMIIGLGLTFLATKLNPFSQANSNKWFGRLQLLSSASLSLSHGSNDAQKTMAIIAILLYSSALIGDKFYVPFWVVVSCHFVMALGTLAGGWRIVNTMANKITKINNLRGCCAETGAATVIFAATAFGAPVSTTHTVTGSIAGVGLSESFWGTNWAIMRRICFVWVLTVPMTALIAAMIMLMRGS